MAMPPPEVLGKGLSLPLLALPVSVPEVVVASLPLLPLLHSCFCSCPVAQLCLALCDSMGLQHARPPYPSASPEVAQVRVHCIDDAIHPSHLLMPPSPSALSLSKHQGLFQ